MLSEKNSNRSDEVNRPYYSHIRRLSPQWPHFQYLADFMDISTVPIKERYLTPEDKIERQRRVHVALLTHSPGHHEAVEKKVFTDVETLTKLLGSIELHKKQGGGCGGGTTRLLLVEDLSTTVIEMLGAKFDIDPGFFRGHIGDFVWFNTRDPWVEVPELESCASKRSYFTLRYVQARYFEDERATLAAQMQAGSFNVLRRIYTDGRGAPRFEAPGSDVGLIRSKVSLWVWPHSSSDSGWLGIMLLDPVVSDGHQLWSGYGNFDSPPSMHVSATNLYQPLSESPFGQVIEWATSLSAADMQLVIKDPEYLTSRVYLIILSHWNMVLEHVAGRIACIEWELENEQWRTGVGLDETLKRLHPWRRKLPSFHAWVLSSIRQLERIRPFPQGKNWTTVLQDFHNILERTSVLQNRADTVMSMATAIIAIEESKRGVEEAQSVGRITYLAFVFAPLAFVASFLSMNANFAQSSSVYWVYFAISVPLSTAVVLVTIYSNEIVQLWRRLRDGIRGTTERRAWHRRA